MTSSAQIAASLPKVTITYCTQCRWMLRAAYFAQELLSTFGTALGEVSLSPATGGVFLVHLDYKPAAASPQAPAESDAVKGMSQEEEIKSVLIWDRKAEARFPETKVLKQRVRDHIQPEKDLGHSDVGGKKKDAAQTGERSDEADSVRRETLASRERQSKAGSDADGKCEDCA